MRTEDAREALDRFLLQGNDGRGYVCDVTPEVRLWMNRRGWADDRQHHQVVARYLASVDAERARVQRLGARILGIGVVD